jgi:hypothetical protein
MFDNYAHFSTVFVQSLQLRILIAEFSEAVKIWNVFAANCLGKSEIEANIGFLDDYIPGEGLHIYCCRSVTANTVSKCSGNGSIRLTQQFSYSGFV